MPITVYTIDEKIAIETAAKQELLDSLEAERQERLAKNRAYKAVWRSKNKDKIRVANRRYYEKKKAAKAVRDKLQIK